jgi:hypothetical protein
VAEKETGSKPWGYLSALAFLAGASYFACLSAESLVLVMWGQPVKATVTATQRVSSGKLNTTTTYTAYYEFMSGGKRQSGKETGLLNEPSSVRVRYLPDWPTIHRAGVSANGMMVPFNLLAVAIAGGVGVWLLRKYPGRWKWATVPAVLLVCPGVYLIDHPPPLFPAPAPQVVAGPLGNTSGNLANRGYLAVRDNVVFSACVPAEDGGMNCLQRRAEDGVTTLLHDSTVHSINVHGDDLFFICWGAEGGEYIYRVGIHGGEARRVRTERASELCVKGDDLFYLPEWETRGVFRVGVSGGWRENLADDEASCLCVDDEGVYYVNHEQGHSIFRVSHNGVDKRRLTDDWAASVIVHGGWLYYRNESDDDRPYRVATDGTGRERLADVPIQGLNAQDHWLYFVEAGQPDRLCRMPAEGGQVEVLAEREDIGYLYVTPGVLVFLCGPFGSEVPYGLEMPVDDTRPGPVRRWP